MDASSILRKAELLVDHEGVYCREMPKWRSEQWRAEVKDITVTKLVKTGRLHVWRENPDRPNTTVVEGWVDNPYRVYADGAELMEYTFMVLSEATLQWDPLNAIVEALDRESAAHTPSRLESLKERVESLLRGFVSEILRRCA